MKNLDRQVFTGARGQASGMCYPLNLRAWLVCVLSIILSPFTLFAQAPVISYSSPQTYEAGTAISQLAPTSSGVAATGYGNPGTLATGLVNPQGVAVDAAGNVYVACYGDGTVKKVPAGGGAPVIIGTGFINPTAVAVDAAGNIYVADKGHNAVKEIPAAGGATITLASGINSPTGVAADAGGNVYVTNGADLDVIPVGSGVAQTYRSGFNMPSTVCIDAVGNVYVTCSFQSYYYTVQEIPVGGGTTVTLPDVMAEAPRGIAVDAAGNIYSSAGSVLKFPAGGGSGVTAVNSTNVYGVAVDAAGNLYVTGASGSVKKYKQVGGFYINAALPAGLSFDSKTGIISGTPAAASPATNYTITAYNSSGSSTAVVNIKVDLPPLPALSYSGPQTYTTGTAIAPLAPASSGVAALGYGSGNVLGSGFANPQGIAVDAAGNVYVACHDDGTVKKIPGGGGTPVVIGSGFNSPTSVAVDAAGNVCVADSGNNAVKKIPAGGGVPVSIGSGFNGPHSVAIDGAGNVYVADYSNVAYQYGRITEIPAGGAQITLVTDVQFSVTGVAVDAAGNVYYVTALYSQITEIPAGGNSTYIGDVGNASNLAVDPAGNVYAALSSHGGGVSISAGGGASVVLVPRISPFGVAIDVTGNLYVTTTDGVIEKYNPVGGYYINAALLQGLTFNSNTGIISGTPTAAIPATNYTITAYNSRGSSSATVNIAVNFPPLPSLSYSSPHTYSEGTAIVPLAPTSSGVAAAGYGNGDILAAGLANPQGMAIDVAGNLYVACYNDGTVKKVPAGGGAPVVLGSGFNSPTGVAVDAAGNVYVADYGNKAVKKIPAAGGAPVTLASGITNLTGIAADAAGNVYVIGGNLYEIPVGKGVILVPYNFPNEYSVCIDAAGNIYVGYQDVYEDTHETIYVGAVAKIPAGGGTVITEEYGFTSPLGMTVDAAGNLYVATNNFIDKIPAGGGADFAVVSNVNTAGVAIDAVGNLYVATGGGNAIEKYKPVGGFYINAALPAGLNFDETTGIISGTPTAASPATNYTVTAYNSGGGASATLNIKVQSTDADLSALQISSGTLMPGFAPGIIAYTADVPNTVTSIAVTPTTSTQGATVNVNGTAVTSGTASPGIPLNVGPNTITTVVTVLDGTTTKTYTLTVTRAKSGDATLKGITMSTGSTPTFSVGGSYTASVSPGIASLTLTPTATDPNATITVNGVAVTSGTASQSLTISTNPTVINIQVTAADGVTKKNYTVTVSKNGSGDAGVDIALSTGSTLTRLSSAGAVNDYTASVTAGTSSLTVTPTASDPNATIAVDGVAVASGTASQSISINTNPTVITVQVTAQDGTVRTNSISVYKNGSSDAGLNVALSTGSMLTYLSSANDVNYYSASVTAGTGSLTVTPTAADPNATITVDGVTVASGTASQSIAINTNPTVITVQLTAQDGTTVRTRSINVYKDGSSDAGFVVSLSTGSPLTYLSGSAQTFYYSASVTAGTTSLTVTPVTKDPNATITVDGIAVTSGTASQSIALNTSPTIITVQETAQDGVTVRTHSISVYQAPSPPPALNSTDISVTKPADSPAIAEDGILVHPGLSPNGDGINDFLQIDNISQYPDNKLSIMNRTGQLIYEAKGYDNSSKVFDGHSNKNGQMQLPGTYFYQLDYTVNGVTKRKTGFLVLKY